MMKIIFMFSIIFIFMKHPLSLGMILLIQLITINLLLGTIYTNFWYSYIITLIFIGGLMILFLYMTSIASNEKFKFNPYFLFFSFLMSIFLYFMPKNTYFFNHLDHSFPYLQKNFFMAMSKFYHYPFNMLLMILIIYLLFTMIAIIKISQINKGPLRHTLS